MKDFGLSENCLGTMCSMQTLSGKKWVLKCIQCSEGKGKDKASGWKIKANKFEEGKTVCTQKFQQATDHWNKTP